MCSLKVDRVIMPAPASAGINFGKEQNNVEMTFL